MAARLDERRRLLAIAVAVAAHLLLLLALAWAPRQTAAPEPPAMQVILSPLPWAADRRPSRRSPARTPPLTSSPLRPASPADTITPALPSAPSPPASTAGPTLKGLFGCSPATLHRLSPEARTACEERAGARARLEQETPRALDLDPQGRFAADDTPYLNRRPKNGCKVGAGGSEGGLGRQGAAAGLTCAWSF